MRRKAFVILAVVYTAAGLACGLLLGWAWQMGAGGCDLDEMSPVHLREYLAAVAGAGPASRDEARCALPDLPDTEIASLVEEAAAQAMIEPQGDREAGRALVALASMFGRQRPDLLVYAATLEASSPRPTEETAPTPAPEAAQNGGDDQPSFAVTRLQSTCDRTQRDHMVQVQVYGPDGRGLAGQRIRLEWQGGAQDAVTGVKAVEKPGYADFTLSPGISYRLFAAGAGGEALSRAVELSVAAAGCGGGEGVTWLLDLTRSTPPST